MNIVEKLKFVELSERFDIKETKDDTWVKEKGGSVMARIGKYDRIDFYQYLSPDEQESAVKVDRRDGGDSCQKCGKEVGSRLLDWEYNMCKECVVDHVMENGIVINTEEFLRLKDYCQLLIGKGE